MEPSLKNSPLMSPGTFLALMAAVAIVVAALLVVLSQLGSGGGGSASKEDVGKLYSGIPQNGTTLGKSAAPVTVYLYEDFQCPFCVDTELSAAQAKAQSNGVNSTPTLVVSGPNGQTKLEGVSDYAEISEAIEQVDGS